MTETGTGTGRISDNVDMDIELNRATGPVTRSKSRASPRFVKSEPESDSENCKLTSKSGPRRINRQLTTIKMEVDCIPKKEEVKTESQDEVTTINRSMSRSTTNSDTSLHTTSQRIVLLSGTGLPSFTRSLFQGQKTEFSFANLMELSSHLEHDDEKVPGILLHVDKFPHPGLTSFLTQFGHLICKLNWWNGILDEISPSYVQKVLTRLPNLSHLHIAHIPFCWQSKNKIFPPLPEYELLKQIKTVSFGFCSGMDPKLLGSLFRMTPNVDNILDFPLDALSESVINSDELKFDKIRSVALFTMTSALDERSTKYLENLAKISPKINLEMIHFRFKPWATRNKDWADFWKSCWESFFKILENNKTTIEYLKIEPLVFHELLEYPKMTAVKKLCLLVKENQTLEHQNGKTVQFFGDSFYIGKTFPNLVDVYLEGNKNWALAEFLKLLPEDVQTPGYFKGVSTLRLKMGDFGELKALQKVAQLFPDVTTLSIGDLCPRWLEFYFPQVLQLWPKLVNLKMTLRVTSERLKNEFFLDPVFTGIPIIKCSLLRKHLKKRGLNIQEYRQNFAISNMTELKELIMIFGSKQKQDEKVIPCFSHVTAFYGFQCLPDLKVTFAVARGNGDNKTIREMLRPIEKHVNLIENYHEPRHYYEDFLKLDL